MTLKDYRRLRRKLNMIEPDLRKGISKHLAVGANEIRTEAIKSMESSPPDSSRTYKRRSVTHSASSPGRPPRPDRGGAGGLISEIFTARRGEKYVVGSSSSAPHGKYLEFGTSTIKPRPWLSPAFIKVRKQLEVSIQEIINNGLRKIAR